MSKKDWNFENGLYKSFDSHIEMSIPGLKRIHEYIIRFSEWFAIDGSTVYDIGSSTGKLLKNIKEHNSGRNLNLNGIEIVPEMINSENYSNGINFINDSIVDFEFSKCDFVISCFSIQFINKKERNSIYKNIYNSLNQGGCFMLAEKTMNRNSYISEIKKSLLFEDKVKNGLSESEILSKDIKLRGVMNLDYEKNILENLQTIGYSEIDIIFKDNEFTLYCAIK